MTTCATCGIDGGGHKVGCPERDETMDDTLTIKCQYCDRWWPSNGLALRYHWQNSHPDVKNPTFGPRPGDTYRRRAVALRRQSWKFRARWRMAEMEVRDVIKLLDKRQDAHAAALAAAQQRAATAEAERDAARAENDDYWMLLSRIFATMPQGLRKLDYPLEYIANVTPEFAVALRNVAIRIIKGETKGDTP